jgi:hypothetical protein
VCPFCARRKCPLCGKKHKSPSAPAKPIGERIDGFDNPLGFSVKELHDAVREARAPQLRLKPGRPMELQKLGYSRAYIRACAFEIMALFEARTGPGARTTASSVRLAHRIARDLVALFPHVDLLTANRALGAISGVRGRPRTVGKKFLFAMAQILEDASKGVSAGVLVTATMKSHGMLTKSTSMLNQLLSPGARATADRRSRRRK